MDFTEWLKLMVNAKDRIGPDHAVREFVIGLHNHDKLYHFDDDPKEIVDALTEERIFTDEQAELVSNIVNELHCEEMFAIAVQLTNEETD